MHECLLGIAKKSFRYFRSIWRRVVLYCDEAVRISLLSLRILFFCPNRQRQFSLSAAGSGSSCGERVFGTLLFFIYFLSFQFSESVRLKRVLTRWRFFKSVIVFVLCNWFSLILIWLLAMLEATRYFRRNIGLNLAAKTQKNAMQNSATILMHRYLLPQLL